MRKEARHVIDQFGIKVTAYEYEGIEMIQGELFDERDDARAGGQQLLKFFGAQLQIIGVIRVEFMARNM